MAEPIDSVGASQKPSPLDRWKGFEELYALVEEKSADGSKALGNLGSFKVKIINPKDLVDPSNQMASSIHNLTIIGGKIGDKHQFRSDFGDIVRKQQKIFVVDDTNSLQSGNDIQVNAEDLEEDDDSLFHPAQVVAISEPTENEEIAESKEKKADNAAENAALTDAPASVPVSARGKSNATTRLVQTAVSDFMSKERMEDFKKDMQDREKKHDEVAEDIMREVDLEYLKNKEIKDQRAENRIEVTEGNAADIREAIQNGKKPPPRITKGL